MLYQSLEPINWRFFYFVYNEDLNSTFRDIFSALTNGPTCKLLHSLLVKVLRSKYPDVEAVIGLEARGFLFSFSLAAELGIRCIPVRKKGKLPGDVASYSYDLEYGSVSIYIYVLYIFILYLCIYIYVLHNCSSWYQLLHLCCCSISHNFIFIQISSNMEANCQTRNNLFENI